MTTNINPTPSHTDEEKYHTKPWFLSQLFKTLLINCSLNLVIWGGVIATLPFFGPEIEHFLFPSVKHIQTLRNEVNRIHIIQDEKGKALSALTEKTQRELAVLQESFNKLSDQVKALQNRVAAPAANLPVSELSESARHWHTLLQQFDKGEPFEEQLHALDPFIAGNKDILMAAHELVDGASKRTRPFYKLTDDLLVLKKDLLNAQHRNNNNPSAGTKSNSWIDDLWEKAKGQISFERTDQATIDAPNPSLKETLIKTIETAVSLIEEHQIDAAIKTIKAQQALGKPIFDQWIADADMRVSVGQKIETLRQRLAPLLNKKVN
jgi:hypothetical protein